MPRDRAAPLIMWTWQDDQVEQHGLLDDAIADIAAHGFGGALAMLRGCRYPLSDPQVVAAARHAAASAHARGLAFWFALDPRLDQGRLIALPGGRTSYVLTGRSGDGTLPCETPVGADGSYRVRLEYGSARGQHMLSQVAITFEPAGIESVVTYRKAPDGTVLTDTLRDVSAGARLFIQRAAGYVEIFGRLEPPPDDGWSVLALARCSSSYPDLGSAAVVDAMHELARTYRRDGVELDGVFSDEIGYVTSFGADETRLPWSPAIHDAFARRSGTTLTAAAPLLLLDDDAGHAGGVRRDYFAAVQDVVIDAQARGRDAARQQWGGDVHSGIHQTWHQNADDLPHGTGDWWRGSQVLSGGFTDVGVAERFADAEHLDELVAMVVIATSLGRHHEHRRAYCNVWGVDFGPEIVDWWVHLLAAFGVTWLAHTYGPTSYTDCETGWGPGYPHHPTWDHVAVANAAAVRIGELTGGSLPTADVAVVYPIDRMATIGSSDANAVARDAHRIITQLVRDGVAVDVISPELFRTGTAGESASSPATPHGRLGDGAVVDLNADVAPADLLDRLPRPVARPPGSVTNRFPRGDGTTTWVITPMVPGASVAGTVRARGIELSVADLRGIAAVRVAADGQVVEQWCRHGTVEVVR